ncbi:tetratricopeptide repeat protein [Rheinheimera sp. WS51]|uniref:tetratricopeptide repeat protein n=1 Tax=Rheinheimera sp. WS51 TaxID=3425886 RepID=UPI003D8AEFAE
MKVLLLLIASSLANADLSHYEQLLAKSQFTELEQQLIKLPEYKQDDGLITIYARALINQQRYEDANTLLNFAIEQFPNNSELNYLAGLSKIHLASDGNIFSAKDRAKRGELLLKKAISLDAKHYAAKQALIDFYSIAPAAAGGDKELAQTMAEQLAKDNPSQGLLAQSRILINNKKPNEALSLLTTMMPNPPTVRLLMRKAQLENELAIYDDAFNSYKQAAEHATDLTDKYNALYHIGRLAVIADQDATIGISALQQYLEFYQDSENKILPWATLRLAQLMYRTGDNYEAGLLVSKLTTVQIADENFNLILLSLTSAIKSKSGQANSDSTPEQN